MSQGSESLHIAPLYEEEDEDSRLSDGIIPCRQPVNRIQTPPHSPLPMAEDTAIRNFVCNIAEESQTKSWIQSESKKLALLLEEDHMILSGLHNSNKYLETHKRAGSVPINMTIAKNPPPLQFGLIHSPEFTRAWTYCLAEANALYFEAWTTEIADQVESYTEKMIFTTNRFISYKHQNYKDEILRESQKELILLHEKLKLSGKRKPTRPEPYRRRY